MSSYPSTTYKWATKDCNENDNEDCTHIRSINVSLVLPPSYGLSSKMSSKTAISVAKCRISKGPKRRFLNRTKRFRKLDKEIFSNGRLWHFDQSRPFCTVQPKRWSGYCRRNCNSWKFLANYMAIHVFYFLRHEFP